MTKLLLAVAAVFFVALMVTGFGWWDNEYAWGWLGAGLLSLTLAQLLPSLGWTIRRNPQ